MQDLFNFICDHYHTLVDLVILIVSVVIFIIRKKPVNGLSDIIQAQCSTAIKLAEQQNGLKGEQKLSFAVNYVKDHLLRLYPNLDVERYKSYIMYVIEDYLSTPQKH